MSETGKFRNKKEAFTPTSNKMLFDNRLDMDTRTLHSIINYYISIPNFTLYKGHLQRVTGLGQKAFNRMWKQLKETGYLVQHKLKGERGVFYYEYELFDVPQVSGKEKGQPEAAQFKGSQLGDNKLAAHKGGAECMAESPKAWEVAEMEEVMQSEAVEQMEEVAQSEAIGQARAVAQSELGEQALEVESLQVAKEVSGAQTREMTKSREGGQPASLRASLVSASLKQITPPPMVPINKTLENKTLNNKTLSNQENKQQQEHVVVVYQRHVNALDLEIIAAYQRAFAVKPAPQVREGLAILLRRFEKSVVLYAIELAGDKGKGFDYAQGVLRKLQAYGAYTMDAVFEYEENYLTK